MTSNQSLQRGGRANPTDSPGHHAESPPGPHKEKSGVRVRSAPGARYSGAMTTTPNPIDIESRLLDLFEETGLTDIVGGPEVLREGINQLKAGLLQVVADMAVAEQHGVALSEAVFDTVAYPHLASLHGFFQDLCVMDLPADIRPWAERAIKAGPPPDVPEVRRWMVYVALRGETPLHQMLAKLVLFEGLCLNQRLLLRAAGEHLEALAGRRSDVEKVADVGLLELLDNEEYAAGLEGLEDPWPTMVTAASISLTAHAQELREQVGQLDAELRVELDVRGQFLDALDGLPPVDAVLLRNACATALGEERVTVEQLQVRHPGVLGGFKRNTLDQRLSRLMGRGEALLEPRQPRSTTLLDLIMGSAPEVHP